MSIVRQNCAAEQPAASAKLFQCCCKIVIFQIMRKISQVHPVLQKQIKLNPANYHLSSLFTIVMKMMLLTGKIALNHQ